MSVLYINNGALSQKQQQQQQREEKVLTWYQQTKPCSTQISVLFNEK